MHITLKENETMQDLVDRLNESASLVYGIAPVAYWYENLYPNGRIKDIRFSDHMREKLGYRSAEEFPDDLNVFMTFLHPDDVQLMLKNAIDAGTGKTDKYELQYRIRRADGTYMWCKATGELVKDHRGTTVGMYGAFIDITEEVELREKAVVESLADAYLSLYQVNLNAGTYIALKRSDTVPKGYADGRLDFYEDIARWINAEIYPEDRAKALEASAKAYIRDRFALVRSYSINIRHNRYGNRYREMRFVRASDYEQTANFFVSFIDNHEYIMAEKTAAEQKSALARQENELKNEKLRKEELSAQMARVMELSDDFQAIFEVDTESGRYEIFSYDNVYADSVIVEMNKGSNFYEDTLKDVEKVVYPEDRDLIRDTFSNREYIKTELRERGGLSLDYRLLINGEPAWYRVKVVRKPGTDGHFLVGIFNIDERVRMEAAYKKKLEQSLAVSDYFISSFVSAYYVDLNDVSCTVLKRTQALEAAYPVVPDFIASIDSYIARDVHPDDRALLTEISRPAYIRARLAKDGAYSAVIRDMMGGTEKSYRFQVIRGADADHAAFGFMDITEELRKEKDAQAELESALEIAGQETRTTRMLYDAISAKYDVMYRIDLEHGRTEIIKGDADARKFFPIFDVTTEDGLFKNLNEKYIDAVIHEDDRETVRATINKAEMHRRLRESSEINITYRAKRNLTDYVYTEMSVIKSGEHDGRLTAIIAAFKVVDAEVRKRLADETALKDAYTMAQAANRAKTAFLNSMSHDIRTPLNAITGYTMLAKKHIADTDSVSGYLDKIEVSGKQLLQLINQVLEMSRIESGKVVLQEEPADVIDRAYDMRTLSGTDIESKSLKYTVYIRDVSHRHVLADGSRMNQIILNIIGNAIKYTPEGGCIDYTVEEKPCERAGYSLYSFTVADTGIGMSEEFQKHLFEEFARENTSTVSHIQGTGLGMPIVKKLVDLMGGTITVKSMLGQGTSITVSVPMKWDTEAQARREADARHHDFDFRGKRILLVEDNEMNREIAQEILTEAGFSVEVAEDGDIAVEKVRRSAAAGYDAILMDIQMPRMNGYEASKAIRALPDAEVRHIPIIALSANAFEEDRLRSLAAGMDDHVSKPIDIRQLKETLAKYL